MQIIETIKTFQYGASKRTLFRLDEPLSDRIPARDHVLKIERDDSEPSWLAAWQSGEIMCFHPICNADISQIIASDPMVSGTKE